MTKFDALRRFLLPCIQSSRTTPTPPSSSTAKKRLSTSLRDDPQTPHPNQEPPTSPTSPTASSAAAPPRSSRTMVIGTIFGHRRGGHAWFCVQPDRLSTKPSLLLELSISISALIQVMQSGIVRLMLEFNSGDSEMSQCHLHSVPVWTLFCNGKKLGFANKRRASEQNKNMLKTMQSITVGAGVIPCESGSGQEEVMYMRANYECVLGNADSESFHLINPDNGPSQELSVFLIRTNN